MRRRKPAADAMHQLAQFVAAYLRFEFGGQGGQHAAPLRRDLAFQQVIENWDHVFRGMAVASAA
jgi:hypothetical protein